MVSNEHLRFPVGPFTWPATVSSNEIHHAKETIKQFPDVLSIEMNILPESAWNIPYGEGGKSLGLAQSLYAMVKDSTFSHSPFPCNETEDVEGRSKSALTQNENFTVYPNPARDYITCKIPLAGGVLRIYNILGETVHQQTVAGESIQLDISKYNSGMYQIVWYGPDKLITTQFIVNR